MMMYITYRMTVLYFALSGLDLLEGLELKEPERRQIITWIYSLQILPTEDKGKDRKNFIYIRI